MTTTASMQMPLAASARAMASETAEALAQIESLLAGIDHGQRASLDAPERVALVQTAVRIAGRIDGLQAILIAEAERASASMEALGTPLVSVLAQGATSGGEAAALVYAARAAGARPCTSSAVLSGAVSVKQARAIDKSLNELPPDLPQEAHARAEQILLEEATHTPASKLGQMAADVLEQVAPLTDTADFAQQRLERQRRCAHAARGFSMVPDGRGSYLLRGSLPMSSGQPIAELIQRQADALRRAARHSHERRDPRTPEVTPDQWRADALVILARGWASQLHPTSQSTTASGPHLSDSPDATELLPRPVPPVDAGEWAPRPTSCVLVTLSEESLRERAEAMGVLPDGSTVGAEELRRLCCDAEIIPVVLGSPGDVLDVGRSRRLVTPGLRVALTARDGGCTFPGCTMPASRCEAHHLIPWIAGGPTALSNLTLLCPSHHALVEPSRIWASGPPDRWEMRLGDDGLPEAVPPKRFDPTRTPRRHERFHQRQRE